MEIEITDYELVRESPYRMVEVKRKVELSETELAVAIMADSLGYASPGHAMIHVRDFKQGKKHAFCERGMACFGNDLEKLIERAAYYWYKTSPEKREWLKAFAEAWEKAEEKDPMRSMTISLMYPTLGI